MREWWKIKQGTILIQTGVGKTFTFFKALIKSKAKQCLFLAETDIRLKDVMDDAVKFQSLFGVDPLQDVNFKFILYQSAHKKTITDYFPKDKVFVCADEIDFAVSPKYWNFFKNSTWTKKHFVLCMSATLDNLSRIIVDNVDIGTKQTVLESLFPICFTYGIKESYQDGTTRHLTVWTILHTLDTKTKNIKSGKAGAYFYQTEHAKHIFLKDSFLKACYTKNEELIRIKNTQLCRFIYGLPSKIEICKQLLKVLPGRTVVYCVDSNDPIKQLGIPCIVQDEPLHKDYLEQFRDGKINQIAGNKKLIRGANLNKVDNVIHLSYYGKPDLMRQKVGRMRTDLPTGNIIYIKTIGTQEEKWYESMIQPLLIFPQKVTNNINDIL